MNRPALIISILLTALVMTIAGGVAYSVHNIQVAQAAQANNQVEQAAQAAQDAQATDQSSTDQQLQQALLDREAAYQKMIAEANARLAQDQETMQALQAQVTALQAPAAANPVATASVSGSGVSARNAAKIAAQYLGQTEVYSVEIGAYEGANVYKVTFSSGDVVMVSYTGQVLAVQPGRQRSSGSQAASHSGEHEPEGDDD